MGIIIFSETAKQFLLTEDAVEGLNTAVQNGQVRLALQIIVELIDGIMQVLDYIVQDETQVEDPTVEQAKEKVIEDKPKEQDKPKEKSEPVAKKHTKTELADTQEV